MREIVHIQAGQCGNQIGAKVCITSFILVSEFYRRKIGPITSLSSCIDYPRPVSFFSVGILNKMRL